MIPKLHKIFKFEKKNLDVPLVLANFEPDLPPRAAHWMQRLSERTNASSPAGNIVVRRLANSLA